MSSLAPPKGSFGRLSMMISKYGYLPDQNITYFLLILILCVVQAGCYSSRPPIMSARLCASNIHDISALLSEFREIGRSSNMEFFDHSADQKQQLEIIDSPNAYVRKDHFVFDAGVLGTDGMGVTASELGGSGYQVALFFYPGGKSQSEARKFANNVIGKLRQKWRVDLMDPAQGIPAATDCT